MGSSQDKKKKIVRNNLRLTFLMLGLLIFISFIAKKNFQNTNIGTLHQGRMLMVEKKYDEAIAVFSGIVNNPSLRRRHLKAMESIANCYEKKGDFNAVVKWLEMACDEVIFLKEKPEESAHFGNQMFTSMENQISSQNIFLRLGSLYQEKFQDWDNAVKCYNRFLKHFSQTQFGPSTAYLLGILYEIHKKDYILAYRSYQNCFDLMVKIENKEFSVKTFSAIKSFTDIADWKGYSQKAMKRLENKAFYTEETSPEEYLPEGLLNLMIQNN